MLLLVGCSGCLLKGTAFMHNGAETHDCHVGLDHLSLMLLLCRLWYCSSHLPILTMQPANCVASRAGRKFVQASVSKLLLPFVLCSSIQNTSEICFLQSWQLSVAHKNLTFYHSTLVAFAVRQIMLEVASVVQGLAALCSTGCLVLMQRPLVASAFELEVACLVWVVFCVFCPRQSLVMMQGPLVALAFKLEEGRFGQLTYMRIYSGAVRKGDPIVNSTTGKRIKVSFMLHSFMLHSFMLHSFMMHSFMLHSFMLHSFMLHFITLSCHTS